MVTNSERIIANKEGDHKQNRGLKDNNINNYSNNNSNSNRTTTSDYNEQSRHVGGDNNYKNDNEVVRLRGIPYSTTPALIVSFFQENNVNCKIEDVVIGTYNSGKLTGDAWVQVRENVDLAIKSLNKKTMGRR